MSDNIKKRDITSLIEKEAPNLNNLLDPEDVSKFKELTGELRDTWTKKQMFRTQTEMEFLPYLFLLPSHLPAIHQAQYQ